MYLTGELVVYGTAGVCRVLGLGESMIPGDTRQCYRLCPLSAPDGSAVINTPVEGGVIAIRSLHTPAELQDLAAEAKSVPPLLGESDRQRRELYKQALSGCDLRAYLSVLHSVEQRRAFFEAAGKHLSDTDERFAVRAAEGILAEAIEVLRRPKQELAVLFGIPAYFYKD